MDSFAQWFWLLIWWFLFFAYLVILFQIIGDLFRDRALSGWWKAVWIIFLIAAPFLTALIYIIARGKGMAERQVEAVQQAKSDTDSYIREVAGKSHRVGPLETVVLQAQPAGNFSYMVLAEGFGLIRPEVARTLASGETFSITINP